MARIRTIKPDFFRHEVLQDLESENPGMYPMMVFAALWGHCDKEGRFEWRPRLLKLDILPFLDFDLQTTLTLLEDAGLIQRYEVAGKQYGLVPTFGEHQRISGKEAQEAAKFPEPVGEIPVKQPRSTRDEPESQEGKGREKEREGNGEIAKLVSQLPDDIDLAVQLWNEMAERIWQKRQVHKLTAARKSALRRRLQDCGGVDGWIAALAKVEASPTLTEGFTGKDGRHWPGADFDFLLQEKSFTKLMEGGYDRSDKTPSGSNTGTSYFARLAAQTGDTGPGYCLDPASDHEAFAGPSEAGGPCIDGDVEPIAAE